MIKFLLVHNQLLFSKLKSIWSAGYNNHTKTPGKQDIEYIYNAHTLMKLK